MMWSCHENHHQQALSSVVSQRLLATHAAVSGRHGCRNHSLAPRFLCQKTRKGFSTAPPALPGRSHLGTLARQAIIIHACYLKWRT
jgi:hypothetical protein